MPQRQRYLFVCTNRRPDDNPKGSCAARGSEAVQQAFKEALFNARPRQSSGARVRLYLSRPVLCRGFGLGRARPLLLWPCHGGRFPEIVEALAKGERVERLVMSQEDLARG